jgi:hypothetical protein
MMTRPLVDMTSSGYKCHAFPSSPVRPELHGVGMDLFEFLRRQVCGNIKPDPLSQQPYSCFFLASFPCRTRNLQSKFSFRVFVFRAKAQRYDSFTVAR